MVELWKRAGLPYRPEGRDSQQAVERQMAAFPDLFIGAFHQKRLVGIVIGSYDGRMKGWINRLAVDPEYWRRGLAKQLVKAVETALEKRGTTIFCALIETPNEKSLNLFQKLGYSAHSEILYVSKRKSKDV
jgi:GNAT superfamily N-acetyltransferase